MAALPGGPGLGLEQGHRKESRPKEIRWRGGRQVPGLERLELGALQEQRVTPLVEPRHGPQGHPQTEICPAIPGEKVAGNVNLEQAGSGVSSLGSSHREKGGCGNGRKGRGAPLETEEERSEREEETRCGRYHGS